MQRAGLRLFSQKSFEIADFIGLESFSLNLGSKCPPLIEGRLRFYNMRFCPYAQRTLLVLALKKIPTDIVNVNLKHKPDWLLERNPLGKVPIIEHNGHTIFESSICNEYLDEAFPNTKQILSKDIVEKTKQKMLAEVLQGLGTAMHRTIRRSQDPEALQWIYDALETSERLFSHDYYGGKVYLGLKWAQSVGSKQMVSNRIFKGKEPAWPDYMIWPWFERLGSIELSSNGLFKVSSAQYPKVCAYIERMKTRPEVQICWREPEMHMGFFAGFVTEAGADYDLGLRKQAQI